MSMKLSGFVAGVLVAVCASTAHAERIAVEVSVGTRSADAERVLGPIRPFLERQGFVVDPAVLGKRFASHAWRPGGNRNVGTQIDQKIEQGIHEFEDASLGAAKTLEAALALARANPLAWANEPKYRDQVQRGLLIYAFALDFRAKDQRDQANRAKGRAQEEYASKAIADEVARDEALAELIRNFPSFVVKADKYGAQGEALFLQARKRAEQTGRGSMELEIDDPNVVVYVNESVQPRKTTIGDLVPGRYRVLVVSATESHEYPVNVIANKRSRLVVNWNLDSLLNLDGWSGFAYKTATERQRERELLSQLVGVSSNVDVAATLLVQGGQSAVVGQAYDLIKGVALATCKLDRSKRLETASIERFARCLAGVPDDTPRVASAPAAVGTPRSESAAATKPVTTNPMAATKLAAVGSNATVAAATEPEEAEDQEDEDDGAPASSGWDRRRILLVAGISGVAVGVLGGGGLVTEFLLDRRDAADELDRVCAVSCTSEQALGLEKKQKDANRNALITGIAGGVVVAGGIAAIVLSRLGGHDDSAVSIVPTSGGVYASLGLSF